MFGIAGIRGSVDTRPMSSRRLSAHNKALLGMQAYEIRRLHAFCRVRGQIRGA
jgi:hypothetical protein